MILSVMVYNHKLTFGQWLGAAIVFAGISIEAFVKRKGIVLASLLVDKHLQAMIADVHAKQVVLEKEKAKIKSL